MRHFCSTIVVLAFCSTAGAQSSLQLKDLVGRPQSLADYRGQIVVLNFWATWCVPCRKEMPELVELQSVLGSRGVQFIGASLDDAETQGQIPAFVRRHKINFPVWIGASPQDQASFRLATSIPATVILDGSGNAVFRIIGVATREVLLERLQWLLSDRSLPAPAELVLPAGITPEHFKEHEAGLEDEHEEEEKEAGSEVPS
ncbi:MAG: TlpA family protein disulfide reductase [Acidobacteriota bacterium]